MIKKIKILAPVTVLSMALMMSAGPVLADFSVGNSGTGAESDNEIGVEIDRELNYRAINRQDVDNDFPICINSGDNWSEFGDGSEIETGNIDLSGEFQNSLNANVFIESNDFDPSGEVFNDFTGFDSDNEAFVVWNLPIDIFNSNTVDLNNLGQILANTGHNGSAFNFGFSLLGTGDADLEIEGQNIVNANFSELEDFIGADEIFVGNENTGAFSDNEAYVDIDTDLEIDNINVADINNELYVSANTGENCVEFNGDDCDCFGGGCYCGDGFGGMLATGDAGIGIDLINQANENETRILSGMGWGELTVLNSGTGFDSDNEAEVEIDSDIDVYSNNNADIENELEIFANTGYNDMTANSGSDGSIDTGDAWGEIAIENRLNSNVTEIEMDLGGEITAGNFCTGAESDNEAVVEIDLEMDVDNRNTADIDNDIEINSNTGYNSSEFNGFGHCDGCGSGGEINTGDADASVNIENQVNSNVTELSGFGDLDISAENSGTGFCSDNETSVSYSNSIDITNQNYANINNDVSVNSNTGGNVSDFNGGSGISTGNSSVIFEVVNSGNTNVVEGD